jgi:hypothetical protein
LGWEARLQFDELVISTYVSRVNRIGFQGGNVVFLNSVLQMPNASVNLSYHPAPCNCDVFAYGPYVPSRPSHFVGWVGLGWNGFEQQYCGLGWRGMSDHFNPLAGLKQIALNFSGSPKLTAIARREKKLPLGSTLL